MNKYWNTYILSNADCDRLRCFLMGLSTEDRRPYWIIKRTLDITQVLVHADDKCHYDIVSYFL